MEHSGKDQSSTLVIIVHGLKGSVAKMSDLKRLVQSSYPNADIHVPLMAHASLLSTTRAADLVRSLIHEIDAAYSDTRHKKVVIIGYSMGAVLARRAIAEAAGMAPFWGDARQEPRVENPLRDISPRPWASCVELFVMMASISRGWSVQNAKSPVQSFQWALAGMIGHLLPPFLRPTIFDFRQGSPFIVQTRPRWLEYCMTFEQSRPRVVQFLGTADDVAPPNDTIDFATDPTGTKFMQIELPHSTHRSAIRFYERHQDSERQKADMSVRRTIVQSLLTGNTAGYADQVVHRKFFEDELPPEPDTKIENAVFVVHGIRDRGFWTKKIAARVKQRASDTGTNFVSRTPSYGYFPILPFLLPWYRRQKVEWLMDHYVELAATYPRADIHYMGHSNGTYLCARALIDYPMASFKRIMFAGSVVRPDFPWTRFVSAGRVDRIFNIVATSDWVVAIFPNGLRPLKSLFDLGGAGHRGFDEAATTQALYQMDLPKGGPDGREYVTGGHSAARAEDLWDNIADFFVTGSVIPAGAGNPHFAPQQPLYARVLGAVSPLIVAALATIILGFGLLCVCIVLKAMTSSQMPDWFEAWPVLHNWAQLPLADQIGILILYLFALRFMALRF